jgi:hypothetical protein
MATHYPHTGDNKNKQGLHYTGVSAVIHKPGTVSKGKIFCNYSARKCKKYLTRFFCIYPDFNDACVPASLGIHLSHKKLAMGFLWAR